MNLRNKKFATVAEYDNYIEGNYPKPNVSYIVEGGVMKYQKDAPDPAKQYLTFVILDNNTKLMYTAKGTGDNIQYSTNGGATWTTLNAGSYSPIFNAGDKIMWRGELMPTTNKGILRFANSTGRFNAKGNVMSLLYGDDFIGKTDLKAQKAFYGMFMGEGNLIDASNLVLPAPELTQDCYNAMFQGCTGLTTVPAILPATTLEFQCYNAMFQGCTSLTTAPALPATTLAIACYNSMFAGCTSLTTAPVLPAETLVRTCYQNMFNGCSNLNNIKMLATNTSGWDYLKEWVIGVSPTGTFTKAAGFNIPTGTSGIPSGWTVIEE